MYEMIFKRKSFHLFRNLGDEKISRADLDGILAAYNTFTPLHKEIRTAIRIGTTNEKMLGRGAEYAIEIYSEKKDNYLTNIGYLGQQLDLYLVSKNIGSLWFGIGKPEETELDGMTFVIMILIGKVDSEDKFRKDMFKSKRKAIEDIWKGEHIAGVTDIARFAPSACNSQPWRVEREENTLMIYRYRRPGRIGTIPGFRVEFYNRIDMGIYLYVLELCLQHEEHPFTREVYIDERPEAETTLVAKYLLQ